jgi:hypothetical protein
MSWVEDCATKVGAPLSRVSRTKRLFSHLYSTVPAFSLCFNVAFAPDAWGWRCDGDDGHSESLSREFFRSKVVFQFKHLDISPAVADRFPKGATRLWTYDCLLLTTSPLTQLFQVFLFHSMSRRSWMLLSISARRWRRTSPRCRSSACAAPFHT